MRLCRKGENEKKWEKQKSKLAKQAAYKKEKK